MDVLVVLKRWQDLTQKKIQKKLFKIFKSNGSGITVECILIVADFLDVTFDLKSVTYYPYRARNNELLNINKYSNHLSSVVDQTPSMISNWISESSCNKNDFDKAAPDYNISFKNSGFNDNVAYILTQSKRRTYYFVLIIW